MSPTLFCLLSLIAAASCLPLEMPLAEVANRTLCPTSISIDEDEGRVPRRIKVIKCAAPQEAYCARMRMPAGACCAGEHGGHRLGCVQVHDTVLVMSRANKTRYTMDVPVGCVCAVDAGSAGRVAALPDGPPPTPPGAQQQP